MKRVVPVLIILLLVVPVAADDYVTVLHTEKEEDFRLTGFHHPRVDNGTVSILVKYNLTLINRKFNDTTFTRLDLQLLNETGVVTEKELPTPSLAYQESASNLVRITADTPALAVTALMFRGNHSALLAVGGTLHRNVTSRLPLTIEIPDQKLTDFSTNATIAHRGKPIHVTGDTENVRGVTISGASLLTDFNGEFSGWIDVPENIDTGPQDVLFRIRTDAGTAFLRQLPLTVENRPPTVTVNVERRRQAGQPLNLAVDADDDEAVTNITVTYWNGSRSSPEGGFTLDTTGLSDGNHSYTVAVTDTDNATTTKTRNVTITGRVEPEEQTEFDPNPRVAEDPIGVVREFVSFLTGFLQFLIP